MESVKFYFKNAPLLSPCSKAEIVTLLCSLPYIDYNTNELILTTARRIELSKSADLKPNTISIAISKLTERNILIKDKDTKQLFLNPKLFFFGSDIERTKALELTLRYELQ